LFNITVADFKTHGFAGVGTSSWGVADFDNFVLREAKEGEKIMNKMNRD
jgi:hypothetical protein